MSRIMLEVEQTSKGIDFMLLRGNTNSKPHDSVNYAFGVDELSLLGKQ